MKFFDFNVIGELTEQLSYAMLARGPKKSDLSSYLQY
jgi:hypothetical protein